MDCTEITEGSTVYLPVNVPGAMLAMGDLHALMGDGEVMICGMECAGKVTVRVTVIKDESIPTPAVVNSGNFYTVQSDKTLDLAARKASLAMHGFLTAHSDLSLFETSSLLSLKGNLTVCQIVDPLLTVRMGLELGILEDLGITLP